MFGELPHMLGLLGYQVLVWLLEYLPMAKAPRMAWSVL
jgi:hypothetical protein